jgi:hypothetical protein
MCSLVSVHVHAQPNCELSGDSASWYGRYLDQRTLPGDFLLLYEGRQNYCVLSGRDVGQGAVGLRDLFRMTNPVGRAFMSTSYCPVVTEVIDDKGDWSSGHPSLGELTRNELLLSAYVSHFQKRIRSVFGYATDDLLAFGVGIDAAECLQSPMARDTMNPSREAIVVFPKWYLQQECPIDELLLFMLLHEAAHLTEMVGQSDEFGADDWAARVGLPFYFGDVWTPTFAMSFYEALGVQFEQMMSSLFTHDTWFMPMCYYGSLECRVDHIKGRYLITEQGEISSGLPPYCYPAGNVGNFSSCDSGPVFRSPENRLNITCSKSCTDELENCVSNYMRNSSVGRDLAKLWCVLPTMAERMEDPCKRFPELCHTKADRRQVNKFMRRYSRLVGSANTVRERIDTRSEGKKPLKYQ